MNAKVFVGSSNDLALARTRAVATINAMSSELEHDGARVRAFDYPTLLLKPGAPQDWINPYIDESDLMVLLVGLRVGKGVRAEFWRGIDLFRAGQLHNLLIYFLAMPKELAADPGPEAKRVRRFRRELEQNGIAYYTLPGLDVLEETVKTHLRPWLADLRNAARQKRRFDALLRGRTDEGLIQTMIVRDVPYTDDIIDLRTAPAEGILARSRRAYAEYLNASANDLYRQPAEWYYFIARYLCDAILAGDHGACRARPFVYPVHQHLSQLIRQAELSEKGRLLETLQRWLEGRTNVYATSRDFAAFELGMCQAWAARNALKAALMDPGETLQVRFYAALALGMLRAIDCLHALADVYDTSPYDELKRACAHAILRIGSPAGAMTPEPQFA